MMKAHELDYRASNYGPHEWREPSLGRPFPICTYCGSIHPKTLAESLRKGATLEWSDRKYGWPHKSYLRGACVGHAKFYTEHLKDADPADRLVIERAMGLTFTFDDIGGVGWLPFNEPS